MPKIILGIHGLGNKPPQHLLKEWWLLALREGLLKHGKPISDIPLELVFWADILHPQPLQATAPADSPLFLDEPYRSAVSTSRHRDKNWLTRVMAGVEKQLDRVFLNEDLTVNFSSVTDRIIHDYFKDLEVYYNPADGAMPSPREQICNRLRQALDNYRGYDIMLLSHSMGSIVAFDVLSQPTCPPIHTWVTIGSPLGLPVIVSRIAAGQKIKSPARPQTPPAVGKYWFNVSDMEDVVALDHTLHDDYCANVNGVQAEDFFVYNDYENDGKRNAHKIYGYLRTPEVANITASFLMQPDLVLKQDKKFKRYFSRAFLQHLWKHRFRPREWRY